MKKVQRNLVTGELVEVDVQAGAKVPAPQRKVNAYQEGVKAYRMGVVRQLNPYGPSSFTATRHRKQWFAGWDFCDSNGHTFGGDK